MFVTVCIINSLNQVLTFWNDIPEVCECYQPESGGTGGTESKYFISITIRNEINLHFFMYVHVSL